MGRVINLQGEAHRGLQELLPWFVTGQLDAAEHERVEAHVAGCAECQAEVKFQQRLEAEVAQLPLEVEESWTRMRAQIAAEDERPSWLGNRGAGRARPAAASRGGWMGWAAAAAMLVVSAGVMAGGTQAIQVADNSGSANFHVLGAKPAAATPGNVVVIFRPDASEKALRESLRASGARLVDGPTAADGYVLRVAPERRDAALAILRGRSDVVLAEPLDAGLTP